MATAPEIITPPVTAFTSDGEVDWVATRGLLEYAEPYVDGVFAVGTTGEFPALSRTERKGLINLSAEVLGPERTIAHIGGPSMRQTLEHLRDAEEAQVDRFAAITPYYLTASDRGILRYFESLRARISGELYVYVFPDVACSDVSPSLLAQLVEVGVDGVKISGTASARAAEYMQAAPSVSLWSGNDATLPDVFALGGRGIVSGVSGVAPQAFARLRDALAAGDADEAMRAQRVVVELVAALGPSITRLRTGLTYQGLTSGESRMPIDPPSPEVEHQIATALETLRFEP